MTALPIIETQAGDISAYIPTNVISITDGQIFLQTELFNSGVRPAVDSGLSVSRVGSAAQTKAIKAVSGSLKLELAQYRELLSFAQFGSDLDAATKATIDKGAILTELLKQPQYSPLTMDQQVCSLFAAKYGFLKDIAIDKILDFEKYMHKTFKEKHPDIIEELNSTGKLSDELIAKMKEAMAACLSDYKMIYGG